MTRTTHTPGLLADRAPVEVVAWWNAGENGWELAECRVYPRRGGEEIRISDVELARLAEGVRRPAGCPEIRA